MYACTYMYVQSRKIARKLMFSLRLWCGYIGPQTLCVTGVGIWPL